MKYRPELKQNVLDVLKKCVGKHNAISADELFTVVTGDPIVPSLSSNQTRIVRSIVREIRNKKELPICSGNGYWVAENEKELADFVEKQLRTARRMFKIAHSLSGIPIDHMVKQFQIKLENEERESGQQ